MMILILLLVKSAGALPAGEGRPVISSISPPSVPPAGGSTVTITGERFANATAGVVVTLGGAPCSDVRVLTTRTLTCVTPAGSGAGINVVVVADGWYSEPKPLFSYHVPVLVSASRLWGVGGERGTRVNVTSYHLGSKLENIRCRVGGTGPGSLPLPGLALPGTTITCILPVGSPTGVHNFQVSNDHGRRWGSAAVVQIEPSWPGGKQPSDGTYTPDPLAMTIALVLPRSFLQAHPSAAATFHAAIEAVNRKAYLGAGSELIGKVVSFDALTEASAALSAVVRNEKTLVGVVGGYYSENAPLLANITCAARVPFVVTEARSTLLSSPAQFPCVVRLGPTTADIGKAVVSLLRRTNWDQGLAILTQEDLYSKESGLQIEHLLTHANSAGRLGEVVYHGNFKRDAGSSEMMSHARAIAAAKPRAIFIEGISSTALQAAFDALATTGILNATGIVSSHLGGLQGGGIPAGTFAVRIPSRESYCTSTLCIKTLSSALIHDSVQVIASGIQSAMELNEGRAFFQGLADAREAVLADIRGVNLGADGAATGQLRFLPRSNDRYSATPFKIYNARDGKAEATKVGQNASAAPTRELQEVGRVAASKVVFNGVKMQFPGEHAGVRILSHPEYVHILIVTLSRRTDLVAARAAVRFMNEDPNILPFSTIRLNVTIIGKDADGKRDPTGAAAVAAKLSVESRANFSAMLACCSSVAIALLNAKQPAVREASKIGFWSSSPYLSNSSQYPKFVRTVFNVAQSQAALLELMVRIGWRKLFVIADEYSPFARGLLDALISGSATGYTTSNTASKMALGHALVDFRQSGDAVRDVQLSAAFAQAKFENFSVILPLPDFDSDILHVVRAGVRSKLGPWQYVFCNQGNAAKQRVMSKTDELDTINAVQGAIELESQPFDRTRDTALAAASSWRRAFEGGALQDPMVDAFSGEVLSEMNSVMTNPGLMDNVNQPSIAPFLYDAVLLAGNAASACDQELDCDFYSHEDMMRHLRSVAVKGLANENIKVLPGKNDVGGIPMALYSNNIIDPVEKTLERRVVGTAIVPAPKIRVCPNTPFERVVGDTCQHRLSKPSFTYAGPLSSNVVRLQWKPAPLFGGLLAYYSISAKECMWGTLSEIPDCQTWPRDRAGAYRPLLVPSESTVVDFPLLGQEPTAGTLNLEAPSEAIKPGAVYEFALHAVYDAGTEVATEVAKTNVDLDDAYPCLPVRGENRTCLCSEDQFHSNGLPDEVPRLWRCKPCPAGVLCMGRTFLDITTQRGYFVTGYRERSNLPRIYKCPGGADACPGNFRVLEGMSTNKTTSPPLLLSALVQQCTDGYAGLLCKTCADGYSWRDTRCVRCSMDKGTAVGTVLAILAGAIIFLAVGAAVAGRLSRRGALERRFIADMLNTLESSKGNSVTEHFQAVFDPTSSGTVTRDTFWQVLTSTTSNFASPPYSEQDALKLWNKLDIDMDGSVSDDEFVGFFYSLRDGTASTNPWRVLWLGLWRWAWSVQSSTTTTVLIIYFQLTSAVRVVFPATATATSADFGPDGTSDTPTDRAAALQEGDASFFDTVVQTLQPAFDLIGNINVEAIGFINCLVGPRHSDSLRFSTLLLVGLLLSIWLAVLVVDCCRALTKHWCKIMGLVTLKIARASVPVATKFSAQVIFLLYPRAIRSIMRSFVCEPREGIRNPDPEAANNRTTYWLTDDATVQCTLGWDSWWSAIVTYSLVMSLVVIVGCPLFQYLLLRRWRFPYDRLYEPTEEGQLSPSKIGKATFGPSYALYRRDAWAMGSADMIFKFVLSGLLGVLFGDHQADGLAFSSVISVSVAFIYASYRPFSYSRGNQLAACAYLALAAQYLEGASRLASYTGREGAEKRVVFEAVVFTLWMLPIVMCLCDLLRVEQWPRVRRLITRCHLRCCKHRSRYPQLMDRAPLDARRTMHFHLLLVDLKKAIDHVVVRGRSPSDEGRARRNQAAVDEALAAFREAVGRLSSSVVSVPLQVQWQDLVDSEERARDLSKLIYGRGGRRFRDACHESELKGSGPAARNLGRVILSHSHVRLLWTKRVMQDVRAREEGDGPPDMHAILLCHHAVLALLIPCAHFGEFQLVRLRRKAGSPWGGRGRVLADHKTPRRTTPRNKEGEKTCSSDSSPRALTAAIELTEVAIDLPAEDKNAKANAIEGNPGPSSPTRAAHGYSKGAVVRPRSAKTGVDLTEEVYRLGSLAAKRDPRLALDRDGSEEEEIHV